MDVESKEISGVASSISEGDIFIYEYVSLTYRAGRTEGDCTYIQKKIDKQTIFRALQLPTNFNS